MEFAQWAWSIKAALSGHTSNAPGFAGGYLPDNFRRAATYVDRIIKGSKPADLPVEQPTKVELLVNLQTAKTLGIEVPLALLLRADELLE